MELSNIENLLEKYESAETTLKEEAVLKDYFSQEDVPAHLAAYRPLFVYYTQNKEERFTKAIPLKRNRSNYWWLSIAASVTLVFSVYFMNGNLINGGLSDEDKKEAARAYEETQKAFQMISQNLNKGGNVAMAGLSEFEKAQNKVFKTE